ncbi:MAG TPA: glycosyltransferase family 4 protein [Gammaproteobacteria bacterium]|nr:glycosyltransferase family 4 protein [Gammaproteobacteria bacterium]
MKILYHHRISSRDGQYVHIDELTTALRHSGHEVIMAGPRVAGEQEFGSESRLVAVLKRHLPKAIYELLEFFYSFIDFRYLSRAIGRHRPDIIYERYNLFWLSGIWAKRRYGIPLISEVNAPLFDERSRYGGIALKRLARFTERASWRGADCIATVTDVLAERIAREGVPREKIVVTPNGVNRSRFPAQSDRATAKRHLGLDDSLVIGFTGFAREWHGLERVIEVLAALSDKNVVFLLVGDGDVRTGLERLAEIRGVRNRLRITGIKPRDQVATCVQAFDIALQPAVVDYASPLKLFEYMACGAAIVAPDKANIREVISHEHNALLFDPAAADSFRLAVERLCHDPALRSRLGAAARRTLDERDLTWDRNARTVVARARYLVARTGSEAARAKWGDSNVC